MATLSPLDLYQARLMPAAEAAALIPSGARIAMGLGAAYPSALLAALADRARSGAIRDARLYYLLSAADAGRGILSAELNEAITPVSIFHGGAERALDAARVRAGQPVVDMLPALFSQVPRLLTKQVGVDTLVTTVSPMDATGHFSLGTNTDYALAVARSGARLILEVNPAMPYAHGDCMIHVSDATALVENATPLPALSPAARSPVDDAIGAIIAGLVDDGACLQMGIGALPDAVCAALAGHRHLGIHTELLSPGLVALAKAGVVDNSRKSLHPGKSVFSFAFGDRALYDFIDHNPLLEAHPVDYVNAPHVIAQNDGMLSVNATLQIDLNGACNSEYRSGLQYSGTGGQLDFVRGAFASRGGRSIIACHATAAKGAISRIVPHLEGPVTTPRTDTHIIVTEYGWADMKGKTVAERARALIALAHPAFRDDLERAAFDGRLVG